jgi:hypothetical protein
VQSFLFCLSHNRLTGVSTYSHTLASALKRRGHRVAIAIARAETRDPLLHERLRSEGLLLRDARAAAEYSHVVCSDRLTLDVSRSLPAKKLFVAHGLGEPLLEVTAEVAPSIHHLFCVSPFMQQHYSERLPQLRNSFLPNVIDTRRFAFVPSHRTLRSVLVSDRRTAEAYFAPLVKLGKKHRLVVVRVSELNLGNAIWEMEKVLGEFDLVLAYGRSAYEAMSCGRNVVVFGQRGGDGFVTRSTFAPMFQRNCSGWGTRKLEMSQPDVWEQLEAEILRFDPDAGIANRRLVEEHLDVEHHVDELLRYC